MRRCRSIFFAVSFICAGVYQPELEPLVEQSFQESFRAYAADALRGSRTPETSDVSKLCSVAYVFFFFFSQKKGLPKKGGGPPGGGPGGTLNPAHGLFTSIFGEEWSNRCMRAFLFPFLLLCLTSWSNTYDLALEPFFTPCL